MVVSTSDLLIEEVRVKILALPEMIYLSVFFFFYKDRTGYNDRNNTENNGQRFGGFSSERKVSVDNL